MTESLSDTRKLACIVEDDEALAQGFAVALEEAGFDSKIFSEGSSALDFLNDMVPSIILLDLNLPGMSGEDILRSIRADERLAEIKVVIISADSTWASYLQNQATIVLTKPIGFRLLRDLAVRLHDGSFVEGGAD